MNQGQQLLEPKDIATILLSIAAITISLYGVWERRRDFRRTADIRLSEVIDEINEVEYTHTTAKFSSTVDEDRQGRAVNARRDVLCNEAERIARYAASGPTASQWMVIGDTWKRIGRMSTAERAYRNGLRTSTEDLYTAYCRRSLASLYFEQGEPTKARSEMVKALELLDNRQFRRDAELVETYCRLALWEAELGGDLEKSDEALEAARTIASDTASKALARRLEARIEAIEELVDEWRA